MSRYTCYNCKAEHGEDNMAAYCAVCYDDVKKNYDACHYEHERVTSQLVAGREAATSLRNELHEAKQLLEAKKAVAGADFAGVLARWVTRAEESEKKRDELEARLPHYHNDKQCGVIAERIEKAEAALAAMTEQCEEAHAHKDHVIEELATMTKERDREHELYLSAHRDNMKGALLLAASREREERMREAIKRLGSRLRSAGHFEAAEQADDIAALSQPVGREEPRQPPCSRCDWDGGTLKEWVNHTCILRRNPSAGRGEKPCPNAGTPNPCECEEKKL